MYGRNCLKSVKINHNLEMITKQYISSFLTKVRILFRVNLYQWKRFYYKNSLGYWFFIQDFFTEWDMHRLFPVSYYDGELFFQSRDFFSFSFLLFSAVVWVLRVYVSWHIYLLFSQFYVFMFFMFSCSHILIWFDFYI